MRIFLLFFFVGFLIQESFGKSEAGPKDFTLPMEGGRILISQVEAQLFSHWGISAVPCIEHFKEFLKLWNEKQGRKNDDEISKIIFPKEFKNAMVQFERCAEKRKIIEERKPLERILEEQDNIGFKNAAVVGEIPYVRDPILSSGTLSSRRSLFNKMPPTPLPDTFGRLQKEKKRQVERLKENYEVVSTFDELEEQRREALVKGRGADLRAIKEEMAKRRNAAKEALLSLFQNDGLSRKTRLNAYEKWAIMENEDKGGVPTEVHEEAIQLIEGWSKDYAEGLREKKKEIQNIGAKQESGSTCSTSEFQAFQELGDVVENMGLKEIQAQAEKTPPDSLQKDVEPEKIDFLLSAVSTRPTAKTQEISEYQDRVKEMHRQNSEKIVKGGDRKAELREEKEKR